MTKLLCVGTHASEVFEGAGGEESARGFETKGVNIRVRESKFL